MTLMTLLPISSVSARTADKGTSVISVIMAVTTQISPPANRAVVTWAGPGQPIMLRVYGPDGGVAVDLTPKRALTLVNELMEPAVASIKIAQWGKPWPG